MQPGSEGLAQLAKVDLSARPQTFDGAPDRLVILPPDQGFSSNLVSSGRTCVLFSCVGMLNTLRRFCGTRMHISVDTKMSILKRQRGIVTVVLQTKGNLQNTSFHRLGPSAEGGPKRRRVQHKAYTTQGKPILQGVIDEESEDNHVDLFLGLRYPWFALDILIT